MRLNGQHISTIILASKRHLAASITIGEGEHSWYTLVGYGVKARICVFQAKTSLATKQIQHLFHRVYLFDSRVKDVIIHLRNRVLVQIEQLALNKIAPTIVADQRAILKVQYVQKLDRIV